MALLYLFAIFLGSTIASFLHCVAVRDQDNDDWIHTRSQCDSCKKQLPWNVNIPIAGFVLSKGKTLCCKKQLTFWHPFLELLGGVLFLILVYNFIQYNDSLQLLKGIIVTIYALYTLASDGRFMKVSVPVSLFTSLSLIFVAILNGNLTVMILSGILGASFFGLQFFATRGKGIGSGDMLIGGVMGLALGFPGVILGIMIGYIIGATHAVVLIAQKKATKKTHMPLGAYLMTGMLIAFLFGDIITNLVT